MWLWVLALVLAFGMPCLLAVWKYHGEPPRIRAAMAWLPAAWNMTGLVLATQLIPDVTGTALRSVEWVAEGKLGDSHWGTRVLSAVGQEAAEKIDPEGESTAGPPPLSDPGYIAVARAITVPLTEDGTAIMLGLTLHGSRGRVDADYLFDTGASFTTITTELARKIGIPIPSDAPMLKFNTATGPRESKMVFVPRLSLGDVEIPGLLVSVCDSCANEHTQGLLGLNVMREFIIQMDYNRREMELLPRIHESGPNRAYDIQPVIEMEVEGRREIWLNRVRWVVLVRNKGTEPIERVLPRVEFSDGPTLYGEKIGRIEPGEVGRSRVKGKVQVPRGSEGPFFTLTIVEAYWG